mmetsp:Transcript_11102/g.14517  ORF Transcript_11102/g.14517 Transcript_11102/m.14517 type:complete len:277 (+) Transcript_11102:381-1211(+)|eukprot:CAMPEP_0116069388 /NCGR_PEP_ID=MMETSP0322-20121206/12267_1 /TAXON_ID=163516 /ORGANISM="Leptocylindrus danicus var. apora, Strain B651" /LENGTH=276 /DNA_ID=CAMNT_0003556761 /DNA_START=380 /DNA_END=1210 /DNA_ORIENTATION=+
MGGIQSSVVHSDEIGIHIQKIEYFANPLMSNLRFNEPKPHALNSLADDAWAGLQLRIDPLAQKITLPSRSMYGLAFLTLTSGAVLVNILRAKPAKDYEDDDLDEYLGSGPSADRYREEEAAQAEDPSLFPIILVVLPVFLGLTALTVAATVQMSRANERIDESIHMALNEIQPRLAFQGFAVEYRTQHTGLCQSCGTTPERVIVFRQLFGVSNLTSDKMVVNAPNDARPGMQFSVVAPNGMLMQVTVPENVQPNQEFMVNIPVSQHQTVAAFGNLT